MFVRRYIHDDGIRAGRRDVDGFRRQRRNRRNRRCKRRNERIWRDRWHRSDGRIRWRERHWRPRGAGRRKRIGPVTPEILKEKIEPLLRELNV